VVPAACRRKRRFGSFHSSSSSTCSSDGEAESCETPLKQRITEDKVAVKLGQLHLTRTDSREDVDITDEELEQGEDLQQRLQLSDDMRMAIAAKDLVDDVVKSEFLKHSKALVVWKPPMVDVNSFTKSTSDRTSEYAEDDVPNWRKSNLRVVEETHDDGGNRTFESDSDFSDVGKVQIYEVKEPGDTDIADADEEEMMDL